MKKICVVTGSRAEFGLLYWLIDTIQNEPDFELQLMVTGSHLTSMFGLTVDEISKAFHINKKVEMVLSSDTPVGISKSMGLGLISYSEAFESLQPELVVLLGDRYEILAAAICAHIAKIPIAHLHGGERSEGAIDDGFRHAITKLSHLHFTATESYRRRVIQLGENPKHVFNVGAMGIENIKKLDLLPKAILQPQLGYEFRKQNFLITYHPTTLDNQRSAVQFNHFLKALDAFPDAGLIFTKANQDTDGQVINQRIDEYVEKHQGRAVSYHSMGQLRYLSTIPFVDVVIGNSSSGLIEVPSFQKPTVNIGDRQSGRIRSESVIDCLNDSQSIIDAIYLSLSPDFLIKIKQIENPYDQGHSSQKICEIFKKIDFNTLIKKQFHDLNE